MNPERLSTEQKALAINLNPQAFGTFAEIGAGQEVVRWFFHVGRSSQTVAKAISAYDMAVSDAIYGPTDRYVSRKRLEAMLDHEYGRLLEQLDQSRGERSTFFVFADTVATRSRKGDGHGWLGIRFQTRPREDPSEVIIHVRMLDTVSVSEQEALGVVGVNFIYAAFHCHEDPNELIRSLMDNLHRGRIEIDMIKCSGPAFAGLDNRLLSVQLVSQGLTDTVMFKADGEVAQPAEALYGKPVLMERGSFRPVTNVTLDMLYRARGQFQRGQEPGDQDAVVLMEMTLNNLLSDQLLDHRDFLMRADILGALGVTVMISNYDKFHLVIGCLRRYTQAQIAMAVGLPTLEAIFDEKHYQDLEGGILEAVSGLFRGPVKLYVYPKKDPETGGLVGPGDLRVAGPVRHLYAYLLDNGFILPIEDVDSEQLHVFPGDVLAMIRSGDPSWEKMVPAQAVSLIKGGGFFGYQEGPKAGS